MSIVVLTLPIPPEKFTTWRAMLSEIAGARSEEFAAARESQGVTRQGVWVQQGIDGPREILMMETDDPARAFELMATSQAPFDIWLRKMLLEIYQFDLTQPAGPLPEQILDWSASEA